MKNHLIVRSMPLAASLALLLAACGGGGGGSSGTTTPPPPVTACGIKIVADATVAAGKTAGAAALSCGAPLKSIHWVQVSGPAVKLLADGSPTVAVESLVAGTIRLKADAVLADGSNASATTDIVVGAAPVGSYVTVRADHSLRPGIDSHVCTDPNSDACKSRDTSVRAWAVLASGDSLSSIVWTQVAGPHAEVTQDTYDPAVLMIQAPVTGADVALKFRATMTTTKGIVDTDEVIVSLDRQAAPHTDAIFDVTARVHPYSLAGAYAGVLARCSYDVGLYFLASNDQSLCTVATLPLLAAEAGPGNVPTVNQIMGRVLVSHDFLGTNFKTFLEHQTNDDFRRLLAGVTTIIIGSQVRPSFYYDVTGAIYLDAGQVWLTPEERDVVSEVADYRSGFSSALNFYGLGRMVQGNVRVPPVDYWPDERKGRPESELGLRLGRLLYHELGHAGDFFPASPAQDRTLNGALSIWENLFSRYDKKELPSDRLAQQYPLTSAEMKGLGQVMYRGVLASELQKSYTAAQVGSFFGADVASDDYAYSIYIPKDKPEEADNSREDLAMLMEEFFMYYRYGARYDVAYTGKFTPTGYSDDLVVAWGQRGRIGSASIKPRVKLVLARVAPWIDASAVDLLPAPIQMVPGTTWAASLVQANPLAPTTMSRPDAPGMTSVAPPSDAELRARTRQDLRRARHVH
ncbi:MAG: hypothetical protein V4484_04335 [Pseudomonadota bacterium]